ncbi:hypothetical protein RFM68_18895 [Mesorhizobium sp. MSK_1335]|uniref:Uncharacterized protein n=1 Tax=Mesorhizobium montanum TaxID=3072323 RepID=A0ABU4ZRA7_9HYPH|nr:hypothetical protein [Mesorhizobium sp. MSK_1335]MDX8526573.1 hypothetical protein [Mesorhizobium sp. MSK_1335]
MPDVVLHKMPPEGLIPQLRRKASKNYHGRPVSGSGHLVAATLAFKISARSITFEDNPGDPSGEPENEVFLQQFLRICEANFSPKKLL